jgi:hypothetical protein
MLGGALVETGSGTIVQLHCFTSGFIFGWWARASDLEHGLNAGLNVMIVCNHTFGENICKALALSAKTLLFYAQKINNIHNRSLKTAFCSQNRSKWPKIVIT